jgi:hypothetical protein
LRRVSALVERLVEIARSLREAGRRHERLGLESEGHDEHRGEQALAVCAV